MSIGKSDIVNADYGIDTVMAVTEKRKWYRWHRFPLVPIFWYRNQDEWNPTDFSFSWLNIRIWSAMPPHLGFAFQIEDTGIHVRLYLPYLHVIVWLMIFPERWHQKLWRIGNRNATPHSLT